MTLRAPLVGLLAGAVALAAVWIGLTLTSDHVSVPALTASMGAFVGLSFSATGVWAWLRRPHNRFGALMTVVGYAWLVGGLTAIDDAWLYTLGVYLSPLYLVLVGQMLLAFPTGRLETTAQRALIALAYADVLLVMLPFFLLGGMIDGPAGAPRNAWALTDTHDAAQAFATFSELVAVGLVVWLAALLVRKRRHASPPQRRAMAPILWTGLVFLVTLAAATLLEAVSGDMNATTVPGIVSLAAFMALPWAFAIGLIRSRYTRAGAVGELVERLGAQPAGGESLRDALAEALGDRSLTLAYWSRGSERYVDSHGGMVELPARNSRSRVVTHIDREGMPVAAIIHDAALLDERDAVRAAGAAAALALENERLEAELMARVAELQASRSKVIEVGMRERRMLERNLHDGAQQRLVALSLQLGLARAKLRERPDVAERILDGARDELAAALEELRELARGIHPAILADRGLAPALEALAGRTPIPVSVEVAAAPRLPMPVEAVVYFVAAESLTNVARYASAEHATVRVLRENGFAVVEIEDNGVGGADPAEGTGLRGLADRLESLDGRLEVVSSAGRGTLVRARIPCA